MKKVIGVLLTTLLFVFTGCGNQEEDYLTDIKTKLEDIGYVFEQRDADAIEYYNNKAVNEAYDIDVTLTDLYIGYVNETEGWLELLVFESNEDAETYHTNNDTGYVIYREGNVLFITYSSDAMAPFTDEGTKEG